EPQIGVAEEHVAFSLRRRDRALVGGPSAGHVAQLERGFALDDREARVIGLVRQPFLTFGQGTTVVPQLEKRVGPNAMLRSALDTPRLPGKKEQQGKPRPEDGPPEGGGSAKNPCHRDDLAERGGWLLG